jgi:hypothetical protein
MALRVFISFAKEDIRYRDLLVGHTRNRKVPFEFVDMSLQERFDSKWKTKCREKIRHCHAFIALLSKKTWRADGTRWEMKCAAEEGIPSIGIHIHLNDKGAIPPELQGRVVNWRWDTIANFVDRINVKLSIWERFFS